MGNVPEHPSGTNIVSSGSGGAGGSGTTELSLQDTTAIIASKQVIRVNELIKCFFIILYSIY
jgi:hypothetical protein